MTGFLLATHQAISDALAATASMASMTMSALAGISASSVPGSTKSSTRCRVMSGEMSRMRAAMASTLAAPSVLVSA